VGLREAGLPGRGLDEAASRLVSHFWLITNESNIAQDFEDAACVEMRRGGCSHASWFDGPLADAALVCLSGSFDKLLCA
jgi:hypothetical protein